MYDVKHFWSPEQDCNSLLHLNTHLCQYCTLICNSFNYTNIGVLFDTDCWNIANCQLDIKQYSTNLSIWSRLESIFYNFFFKLTQELINLLNLESLSLKKRILFYLLLNQIHVLYQTPWTEFMYFTTLPELNSCTLPDSLNWIHVLYQTLWTEFMYYTRLAEHNSCSITDNLNCIHVLKGTPWTEFMFYNRYPEL